MSDLGIEIQDIIIEAGKIIISKSTEDIKFKEKGMYNYVTEIDICVQEFLYKKLKNLIKDSNIIGEESSDNYYNLDKPTFIIDPVDGTTNLMYGYRHSAISVALVINKELTLGFVYNPYTKEMFGAEKGIGAFLNGELIKTSQNNYLKDSLISFGTSPYDKEKGVTTLKIVEEIYKRSKDIRRSGSAALDICYVASGRCDGFFELSLEPWDFSAGALILIEAGGTISDFKGNEINIIKRGEILASNSSIHKEFLSIIEKDS